jgi:pyruvate, orthophosphate dikinase
MTLIYPLDQRHDLPEAKLRALIGNKAVGLAVMATELGLPVPPGFAITTEACRAFLSSGWPAGLDGELRAAMDSLEIATGRRFGDPVNPLLVSVRSGAPISMPGMMDSILNLGLNAATTRGLAERTGDPGFADDCHRRFVDMFTSTVGGTEVPADPRVQLRAAVEGVFRSWNSERARAYRKRERISDDMGTAVTVQAMVFGNWDADSVTGVLFTRNPATGEPVLYGDVLFASQGEDVVAGTHRTQPVTILDERMPKVAGELRRYAALLERHYADLCDIEFTIEQGRLWMLQVRVGKRTPLAALRIAMDMAEAADFPLTRAQAVERVAKYLAHPPIISTRRGADGPALAVGLPASPGVAAGEIATSSASAIDAAEAGRRVILVRSETSPDDVSGMARAVGVLTSRGGLTSHAAVVARGWGIPAVVGAESVKVTDQTIDAGGRVLKVGEVITVDGGTGEIFAGVVTGTTTIAPEAATLLAWARELGFPIGTGEGAGSEAADGSEVSRDDVVRALLIKGSATPEGLAATLFSSVDEIRLFLDRLVADGLAEPQAGGFRLTSSGKTNSHAYLAADRERWGTEHALAALDEFQALDHGVKELVTAWQLREVDGAQAINDHADTAYDAQVLEQLASLHQDAREWLSSLGEAPADLHRYVARLERALAAARAGDQRFLASPRVDSYHGVWFELHEVLILLAGRNRSDEAAAGRA